MYYTGLGLRGRGRSQAMIVARCRNRESAVLFFSWGAMFCGGGVAQRCKTEIAGFVVLYR